MKLLLTGFEPFGGSTMNPSTLVVNALANNRIATAILPVDGVRGPEAVLAALDQHQPDVLLMLGQAAGRAAISIERVAINLMDYRIADNSGQKVSDEPIALDGPAAYFATLPVRAMLNGLLAVGIPAELSLSAGAYLCNQVMYAALHHIAQRGLAMRAGFVHLPMLPVQAATEGHGLPSMALATMVEGISVLVGVVMKPNSV